MYNIYNWQTHTCYIHTVCTVFIFYIVSNFVSHHFGQTYRLLHVFTIYIQMTRQQLIRSIQVSKQVSERTNESLCNDKINANLLILLACTYVIHTYREIVNFTTNWLTSKSASTTEKKIEAKGQTNGEKKEIIIDTV